MKHLIRSVGHLGGVLMGNKGKILMGIGAIALAPALRWAMQRYLGLKAELEKEEENASEAHPEPPRPRRNKREIYQAPKVPPQNLIRH